jgi:transcriptional regulator with XRE-family HTH domain
MTIMLAFMPDVQERMLALAARLRALRLSRGWSQAELAERAGVAFSTLRLFERSGQISLERLLLLAMVLDAAGGFDALFAPAPLRSLDELEERPTRQRGRRRPR